MLEKYIKAAKRETKADLVLKNATYADVFSSGLKKGDIAVAGDRIVGVGEYSGLTEIDCTGLTVLPGFIDGHVHIESSKLSPEEFASLVVPRGTTTVVADPHEIVNVCGTAGCEYMINALKNVPLEALIQLPSCVPATPFETGGATLSGDDVAGYIKKDGIFGLGEFMNYPGVISCDPDALKKLEAAYAAGKIIDGHAPALRGINLNAYLCGGISTDHECVSEEETEEKISKGMYVHIRHGSSARNLDTVKCMNDANFRRFLLCTDDRHASDLKDKGHIDDALRRLVCEYGVNPVRAVTLATLNAAECYGLKYRGAIAPFWIADLVAVGDLKNFNAKFVIKGGKIVAKDGKPLFKYTPCLPESVLNTVRLKRNLVPEDFKIALKGTRAKAITVSAGSLITGCEIVEVKSCGDDVLVKDSGILKLAVVERHKKTGNIGKGLLAGYGFKGGALGTTVAHDSHNIILLGDDNAAMANAANALKEMGGGMVIADSADGKIYGVPLEIGGLMSARGAGAFLRESRALCKRAGRMGVAPDLDAFMSLAFLSLAVIPKLKLLDTGLFDVENFCFTDINA